ncbi:MAG: hypothetical protein KBA82_12845, partial [Nitrosomonas sp.]|jgi:hypothetical protein|nr:hypothetical protein [Nitrosomonas sp.]
LVGKHPQPDNHSLRVSENYAAFQKWIKSDVVNLPTLCKGLAKSENTCFPTVHQLRRGFAIYTFSYIIKTWAIKKSRWNGLQAVTRI